MGGRSPFLCVMGTIILRAGSVLFTAAMTMGLLASCGEGGQEPATETSRTMTGEQRPATARGGTVSVAEFQRLMVEHPGQVLDVRTPGEWDTGVMEGALLIDFYEKDFAQQLDGLDPTRPVFVYCHAGGRSAKAMDMLQAKGFTEVYDLDGGITAWRQAGAPLVEAPSGTKE